MNEDNEEMDAEMDNHYDGWDDESEETDSEDEPEPIKQKPIKRQWKEGEKQKFKEKERPKIIRTNLKYENKELVDKCDDIAEKILSTETKNKYRDHFFPLIIDALELKKGVEIGVDKAGFSLHILNKTKIEKYYCVDNWMDDFGSNCKPGFFDKDGGKRFLEAQKSLQPFINNGRAEMLRMNSEFASKRFLSGSLDFCYIDGDHSLSGIYEDIRIWTPKVKVGGIISGHDYKDGQRSGIIDFFGRQLDYKIKTAVDDFCARHGYPLRVIGGRILNWYFIKNRNI